MTLGSPVVPDDPAEPTEAPTPEEPPTPSALLRGIGIVLIVLALVAGAYNLGQALFGPRLGQDFTAYYVAGRLIRAGDAPEMYGTQEEFQRQADRFGVTGPAAEGDRDGAVGGYDSVEPFLYPPVAAVALLPASLLPLGASKLVFLLVNLGAQFLAIWVLFSDRAPPIRRVLVLSGWCALLVLFPFFWGLYLGQANSLVFLACALALRRLRRGDQLGAGAWIAVAALIKVFPVVLLVLLVLKRQHRAVAASIVTMAALSLLTLPVVGVTTFQRFFTEVVPEITSRVEPFVRNQGISGTLHRLFTDNPYVDPVLRADGIVRPLTTLLALAAVALTIWFTTRRPPVAEPAPTRLDLEWGLWLTMAVLVSTISWEHYAVFLLFAWLPLTEYLLVRGTESLGDRALLAATAASFGVWALLLQSGDEYDALPTSVVLQPIVSAKFLATVVLFATTLVVLRRRRLAGVPA
ncbi:MAG: DUF2029 domain-containing protein [Acidimicrobiales bacterium]|nr:DUF2029 domain-containing protein [Acidimicrobiales bacterium]